MKISYRREIKHNYLIIDPEALIWRNYECRMLAGNQIDGILHFQLRQVDDEIRFYYEITSRQPLCRMLEKKQIREAEIRHLILGISGILDRMEQYLLREGCVLLDPEYIYVEPESFRVWLCLVPGLERDFPEDYSKLLEYLLGKVDHQDKNAVVLAYGLYQETRKENYGMDDILRLLWPEEEKPQEREQCPEERSVISVKAEASSEKAEPEQGQVRKPDRNRKKQDDRGERRNGEKEGAFAKFRRWLKHDDRKKTVKSDYDYRNETLWEEIFQEESEPVKYEKPPEEPVKSQNTTLLADFSKEATVGTRRLRALEPAQEDIVIAYFPFIIGKQEHLADFILEKDTVSRLHVKIDQTENGWSIQDLNSTNGTMVRGEMLENNEAVELRIGDEIRIAEFPYRFE